MPLPTNETTAFYLEDRIIGAKGHFSYSCQTVYLDDIPFFRTSSPVVSVEPFEKEIWIFDAAGTLTVVNAQNKKTLWQRAVGYIPFWTHRSDRWLALLDIYGNFVLLEPQRGYFEVFKYRFGLLKVIDHVTTTPNMLRLYFSPDSVLTYSFDTRASHYEEGVSFDANRIAPTEKGLQQGQEMFYPFEEPLRGFDIADGSIAVLYDRFYTVLFAPRE